MHGSTGYIESASFSLEKTHPMQPSTLPTPPLNHILKALSSKVMTTSSEGDHEATCLCCLRQWAGLVSTPFRDSGCETDVP